LEGESPKPIPMLNINLGRTPIAPQLIIGGEFRGREE